MEVGETWEGTTITNVRLTLLIVSKNAREDGSQDLLMLSLTTGEVEWVPPGSVKAFRDWERIA